jgi:cellulose synthase/poly-beta-1,6-N-acetylglucosamine synthase-like glycosyltransferase
VNLLFWGSALLILYTLVGYPLWLCVRCRWRAMPVRTRPVTPSVTIAVAVYNEARNLPSKLRNFASLDYPADLLEIVIASDGSTDATNGILEHSAETRVRPIFLEQQRGKAAALNHAIAAARHEIVVFTDARQQLETGALRQLVSNFADPSVGCVSGELMLGSPENTAESDGVGLYWALEKKIRQLEGVSGSVVQATGAIYGVRRSLLTAFPPGTILDDVYLPLTVARQGARVIFDPCARAWDPLVTTAAQEFRRKVRTLTGNYQLLQIAPWMLTRANPVRFEFVSHKLMRLVLPFALAGLLISSLLLPGAFYRFMALVQLLFYVLGALSIIRLRLGPVSRLTDAAMAFLVLNSAATMAFFNFVTGKKRVWTR